MREALPRVLEKVLVDVLVGPGGKELIPNEDDEAQCEREGCVA